MPTGAKGTGDGTSGQRGLWFSVLGPVRAWSDGRALDIGPPQQQALLALLLVRPGVPMEVEQIVDALWGDGPPASALPLVYRYIGLLRKIFEPGLSVRASGRWLLRGAGGYRMEVDADSVDVMRFRQLAERARRMRDVGLAGESLSTYVEALALWEGRPADGLSLSAYAAPAVQGLARERHAIVKEAADVALDCGRAWEVLDQLRLSAVERPLDEPLHARLLYALAATDHVQEALRTYRATKARLADELGIEPGAELRTAGHRLLGGSAGPRLSEGQDRVVVVSPARRIGSSAWSATPAQLPPRLPVFVGRKTELAMLPGPHSGSGSSAEVIVVSGPPGVGKTALACWWAHRAVPRFPDGQLYANLHGHVLGSRPADPATVLPSFLRSLGVRPQDVPGSERVRRYREAMSGRRILVFLDDVRSVEQIEDLLPNTPDCVVVVTSRSPLPEAGQVSPEVLHMALAPFGTDGARDCLTARLGRARVAAEPGAVRSLTSSTEGLPLALAVAAARVTATSASSLAAIADELHTAMAVLDSLPAVRAAVDTSYRLLSPAAARVFRLLAGRSGTEISTAAVAAMAGWPMERVREPLGELIRAGLLTEGPSDQYSQLRLVQAYAGELRRSDQCA